MTTTDQALNIYIDSKILAAITVIVFILIFAMIEEDKPLTKEEIQRKEKQDQLDSYNDMMKYEFN